VEEAPVEEEAPPEEEEPKEEDKGFLSKVGDFITNPLSIFGKRDLGSDESTSAMRTVAY
jgi:hypothetical protein